MTQVASTGFWSGTPESLNDEHCYDPPLSQALVDFFNSEGAKTIVDLGCGLGDYSKHLKAEGFEVRAFDGNPDTEALTNGIGRTWDLTEPIASSPASDLANDGVDWVVFLEVLEHIPAEYTEAVLDNVDALAKQGVVMSVAVPGQGGLGHVACRTNQEVKQMMLKRGFVDDVFAENMFRERCTLPWFKATLMAFRRISP